MGNSVLSMGESILGTKYVWGGTDSKKGIDCSGFVDFAYSGAGYNIPGRLTTTELKRNPSQFGFVKLSSVADAQPGDVLWQKGHMGLKYDNGRVLDSSGGRGVGVRKDSSFTEAYRYVGMG